MGVVGRGSSGEGAGKRRERREEDVLWVFFNKHT